ncbi:MAG: FG-GAP repeat domain-containing protein [Desulfuromonadaceae bacterium]
MTLPRMYLVFLLLAIIVSTAWSAPVQTYVAEFSVSGVEKPEAMKATIQTLLLSRLAGEKVATQVKPEGAEIKVTGSYLLSGSSFSLDAVAANSSGTVLTRAFAQGKGPDELIAAVSALAKTLSEGIDKNIGKNTEKGNAVVAVPSPPALPVDTIKPVQTVPSTGLVIHKLAGALSGLAVGRTFPGGDRELFIVGNQTLRYYRQGAELKLLANVQYKVFEKVIAVDSADLDKDGIPEVYVTIIDGEKLVSQVWTVEGTSLKQIAGPLPFFFRVVTGGGGLKKLYAQQKSAKDDFSGAVSEVVKSGNKFQLGSPIKLPKQGYLYNFNLLQGFKGETNAILVDKSRYLKVFTADGDEIWKSSEEYGGSETHFKLTNLGSINYDDTGFRKVYLEQRIIVKPNGELLVPKNTGSWYMLSQHIYEHNSLFCFAWDGANLQEKWHTKQIDFYLADFAYDDNSRELLMLEIVEKEYGIFDKGASRLVIRKVE